MICLARQIKSGDTQCIKKEQDDTLEATNALRSALLQRYIEEDDMQRIGCYPMDHSMMLCCNSCVSKQMQDDTLDAVQRIG